MKLMSCLALTLVACALPAFGQFSVASPYGDSVASPFQISATDPNCGGQPVIEMSYSLDDSSHTTIVNGTAIEASASAGNGPHVLHLMAWGSSATCVTAVPFTVTSSASSGSGGGAGNGSGSGAGGVAVKSPAPNAEVASQFSVSATSLVCSSTRVVAMGYSLDHNANALVVDGQSLTAQVTAPAGPHVLHVKSWGVQAACVADVPITVLANQTSGVPADALVFQGIAQATNWIASHDDDTGSGVTYGDMEFVTSPSLSGKARKFVTTFADSAGERYSDVFGSDTFTHNFLYDGWVYIASPNSGLANLELDVNQVISNGHTIILSVQCNGYSGTWDYGENAGTVSKTKAKWIHSKRKCNPREWSMNAWHHVQISDSRDDSGHVTYHSIWLDGVKQEINATVPGEFSLGWASVLVTNFQVDGRGDGSATLYLDNLTIYAW